MRNLAYEVKKYKQGYFVKVQFLATQQELLELERYCRLKDVILKYCIQTRRRTK